jgi:MFS family permease
VRASGLRNSDYGLLLALNGIIVVLAELPITSWTQHRPRVRMIALGAFVSGIAFALVATSRTMPPLVGVVVIWTLGEIVESPSASAFVADRAPAHARGRYQAALGTMWGLAAVIGPIVGTALFHANENAVWIGCGVAGAIGAWLALAAGRHPASERARLSADHD